MNLYLERVIDDARSGFSYRKTIIETLEIRYLRFVTLINF